MTHSSSQPDIAYPPDYDKYRLRSEERLASGQLPKQVPAGFPIELKSPLVWKGSDLEDHEWLFQLDEDDHHELFHALEYFESLGLVNGQICQKTFPLHALRNKLRAYSSSLHHGRGFFILRGFPVDALPSAEDRVIAFAGLSSYVCSLRGWQDRNATALVHIKDLSRFLKLGTPAYTAERQVFHTDNGDVVALLALEVAAQGGESKLASSWQVYNTLAKERPDLVHTLSQDWPCDSFGGDPAYYLRPLLYFTEEQRLVIQYFRRLFTGYGSLPRPSTIPPITEAQAEALDALEFYSEAAGKRLEFKKGDIQYVNNLSIFHAREGFVDSREKTRHLLRLWLRDEEYG